MREGDPSVRIGRVALREPVPRREQDTDAFGVDGFRDRFREPLEQFGQRGDGAENGGGFADSGAEIQPAGAEEEPIGKFLRDAFRRRHGKGDYQRSCNVRDRARKCRRDRRESRHDQPPDERIQRQHVGGEHCVGDRAAQEHADLHDPPRGNAVREDEREQHGSERREPGEATAIEIEAEASKPPTQARMRPSRLRE